MSRYTVIVESVVEEVWEVDADSARDAEKVVFHTGNKVGSQVMHRRAVDAFKEDDES